MVEELRSLESECLIFNLRPLATLRSAVRVPTLPPSAAVTQALNEVRCADSSLRVPLLPDQFVKGGRVRSPFDGSVVSVVSGRRPATVLSAAEFVHSLPHSPAPGQAHTPTAQASTRPQATCQACNQVPSHQATIQAPTLSPVAPASSKNPFTTWVLKKPNTDLTDVEARLVRVREKLAAKGGFEDRVRMLDALALRLEQLKARLLSRGLLLRVMTGSAEHAEVTAIDKRIDEIVAL